MHPHKARTNGFARALPICCAACAQAWQVSDAANCIASKNRMHGVHMGGSSIAHINRPARLNWSNHVSHNKLNGIKAPEAIDNSG